MSITHARSASMIGPISLWFSSIFRKRLVGIPWVILGSRLFALVPQQPYSVVVHANTLLKFLQLWKQQSSTFVRMRFLQNHTQNDRVKRTFSLVVFLPFLLLVQGITKVYSNNKCLVTYHCCCQPETHKRAPNHHGRVGITCVVITCVQFCAGHWCVGTPDHLSSTEDIRRILHKNSSRLYYSHIPSLGGALCDISHVELS